MALPKKFKKTLDLPMVDPQGGPKAYIEGFLEQNPGNFPRGIDFVDLDNGFVEWVKADLNTIIEGESVPVSFLTAQRWTEFTRTWQNSDKYKNIKIPFMSVVRKPEVQPGTNPQDFNIPFKDYRIPVSVIPTWDGNKKGADVYLIPQPVGVDLTYTVRFFTYRMSELNVLNEKVLSMFASAQAYVNIKGHYFPIMLESLGDESTITDLEGKRYYVQTYELKMMAYILDEDKFEIRPALERAILSYEIDEKRPKIITKFIKDSSKNDKTINLIIQFLAGSPTDLTFQADTIAYFSSVDVSNISNIIIRVNGSVITLPTYIVMDDVISISIVRDNSSALSEVILRGTVPL